MKIISIILCLSIAVANGGVLKWTKDLENKYKDLYERLCSGAETSGIEGDLAWHCKRSPDGGRKVTNTHSHDLHIPNVSKQQVVFIETPADDYRHEVLIKGHAGANHKTAIVVVPATDTHNVDVNDSGVSSDFKAEKPQILFLRNNPNEGGKRPKEDPPSPGYAYAPPSV